MEEKQPEDKIIYRLQLCLTVLQQDVLDKSQDEFSNEKVKRFVACVQTYAQVQTKAFVTLAFANNYMAAHHFLRLLSDCALRVYAVTLFKGKDLEKCLKKFFEGKEPKTYPKYKGKDLVPTYIIELVKEEIAQERQDIEPHWLEWILYCQKEGNLSTHLSPFYLSDESDKLTNDLKKDLIGFYTSLLVFLGSLLFRLQ
ncbi:MAG: hypothetical protein IJX60_05905 [Paludibacteraceae bacterium]|nr:hypothetical protein [Paludibacteraceae bacterium]